MKRAASMLTMILLPSASVSSLNRAMAVPLVGFVMEAGSRRSDQACDQRRYPFLEKSNAPGENCARGENKQIFGMKSQAAIFDPPSGGRMGNFVFTCPSTNL